jgi:DNA-binding CsgD family transcriptional regulator
MGHYLNPSKQGEIAREVLSIVPSKRESRAVPARRQVQRRLRPDHIGELIVAYQAGMTVLELAERFQIHRHTVSLILKRQAVPRRNQPLTAEQRKMASTLYSSGMSLADVGAMLGCDPSTIWRALRADGIQLRPRTGWKY